MLRREGERDFGRKREVSFGSDRLKPNHFRPILLQPNRPCLGQTCSGQTPPSLLPSAVTSPPPGPPKFSRFFPSRHNFQFFSPLLGVFSWKRGRGSRPISTQSARFWASLVSLCETSRKVQAAGARTILSQLLQHLDKCSFASLYPGRADKGGACQSSSTPRRCGFMRYISPSVQCRPGI